MWARALLVSLLWGRYADSCCISFTPDPTFVDSSEYHVDSITPNQGTVAGGSRVTIKGGGFNTNFFSAGNYVSIGSGTTWVPCEVIEGACTVQCGGPKTLICDTGPWTFGGDPKQDSGMLDVKVKIRLEITPRPLVGSLNFFTNYFDV